MIYVKSVLSKLLIVSLALTVSLGAAACTKAPGKRSATHATSSSQPTTTAPSPSSAEVNKKQDGASSTSKPGSAPTNNSDTSRLLFSDIAGKEFTFASGAGSWSTTVKIASDGTFTGKYIDDDLGDTGAGYPNGTRYTCIFNGRFTSLKKVAAYEYSLQCSSLKTEGTKDQTQIINGAREITSDPYGFDDAGEFRLYLPGKKMSELPTEFVQWITAFIDPSKYTQLPSYGLYNVNAKEGFYLYQ